MRKENIAWDLVTPEEAIEITQKRTIEDMRIAEKIAKEAICHEVGSLKSRGREERDFEWAQWKVWATIWNAGRVAGIRSERMKKSV